MDVTPAVIWTLGLPLVLADMLTSPYWRGVGGAIASGQAPAADATAAAALWRTGGEALVLLLLVGVSDLSPEGGTFAALLLLALWVLFLVLHADAVGALFGQFSGGAGALVGRPLPTPGSPR